MRYTSTNKGFPAGNPLANALVIVVGAIAIGASIVLGFVAFIVLAVGFVVLGAIVAIRVWWLQRKMVRAGGGASRPAPGSGVIEGEYKVVADESRSETRD